ncbi:MAG: hypothetical protein R3F37_19370 [Candidatus Competibacteraceae bacterium]
MKPLLSTPSRSRAGVGHPLADDIPLHGDRPAARQTLGFAADTDPWLALLPGSRLSEVKLLAPCFRRNCLLVAGT